VRKLLIIVGAMLPSFAWAQAPREPMVTAANGPTASATLAGQLATMLAMAVDERAAALAQVESLKKQIEDLKNAPKEPPKP
jgi:hypothetical protein